MSRRFTLQFLLPVEGFEEDKIYESEDIALTVANLKQKPDDVYYRCLKERSFYASFHDIVRFACEKYSLGEINNFSIQTDHFGEHKIIHEGNRYIVTAEEAKQVERPLVSDKFVKTFLNEDGVCDKIEFYNEDKFNFAFALRACGFDEAVELSRLDFGVRTEALSAPYVYVKPEKITQIADCDI